MYSTIVLSQYHRVIFFDLQWLFLLFLSFFQSMCFLHFTTIACACVG